MPMGLSRRFDGIQKPMSLPFNGILNFTRQPQILFLGYPATLLDSTPLIQDFLDEVRKRKELA